MSLTVGKARRRSCVRAGVLLRVEASDLLGAGTTWERAKVLEAGGLPDLAVLRRHFAPDPTCLPTVTVQSVSLDSYEALVKSVDIAGVPA